VDLDGGETIHLKLRELFEGFQGAALEEGSLLDDSFHLEEEVLVFGVG